MKLAPRSGCLTPGDLCPLCCAFAAVIEEDVDTPLVVTGSLDGTVKVWNSGTGELIHDIRHLYTDADILELLKVYDLDVSPDGKTILTAAGGFEVDDEELVLNSMRALLTTLGYKVDTATDGTQALNIYRVCKENGDPIDVALMDLTIQGGMGGKEACAKLRTFDPDAKAVVCSGYSNDPVMANFYDYGFSGMIVKPFQLHELANVVNQVLAKSESVAAPLKNVSRN